MYSTSQPTAIVRQVFRIAKNIQRRTTDWWQENFQVTASNKIREHTTCLLKQDAPQLPFLDPKSFSDTGQIPDWLNGNLGDVDLTAFKQYPPIHLEVLLPAVNHFRQR